MAALRREFDGRPTLLIAAVVGIVGAIGVAIGIAIEPERAFAAYLAAWCAVATVAIGGLALLVIGYAANSRWPAAVRRLTEAIAGGLLPVAILAIPLFLGAEWVWPWVAPDGRYLHAVEVKQTYLSTPFFVFRTELYFVAFIIPAELLIRWSRRRDARPEPPAPLRTDALHRERVLSSAVLPIVGLAITFAAFDWLMSLQPAWWSSGFGLYVLTGALTAGLAMVAVLAWRGVAERCMPLTPGHFHAMGRLLHAFVILWAYIAYFQVMLIQIANKPNEAQFYVDRGTDGWRFVTALLVVLGFALPFPLLFPRRLKRRAGYVGGIAVMLLVGHYLDMWWLVIPRVSAMPIPSWTDLAALCAIGGLVTAVCTWRMRGVPLLPVGDPYLATGLAYETTT
ncbi:MAG TPA: hypothetical protein VFV99_29360 [Kofleriaceae bacterium]|nr:hypothetical protein [Kofleriaceae bacterium]